MSENQVINDLEQRQRYINEIINRLANNTWNDNLNYNFANLVDKNERKKILIDALGEWYKAHSKNPEDFDKSEVIDAGDEKGEHSVVKLSIKENIESIVKDNFDFFEKVFEKQPENKQTLLMQAAAAPNNDIRSNEVVGLLTPIQSGLKDKDGNTALSIALQKEDSDDFNIAILFNSEKEHKATPEVENLKNIDTKIKERLIKVLTNEGILHNVKIQDQQIKDFIKEINSSKSPAETLQQATDAPEQPQLKQEQQPVPQTDIQLSNVASAEQKKEEEVKQEKEKKQKTNTKTEEEKTESQITPQTTADKPVDQEYETIEKPEFLDDMQIKSETELENTSRSNDTNFYKTPEQTQSNLFKALTADEPSRSYIKELLGDEKEVEKTKKEIGKLNDKQLYDNQLKKMLEALGSLQSNNRYDVDTLDSITKGSINNLTITIKQQRANNLFKYNRKQENLKLEIERQKVDEERKEAEVTFDNERENAYIEELVNRLKNGQWGKVKLNIDGEKININKEISELGEKPQKYLLTKALKRIYNSNSEDKNELQYHLSLGNNFNIEKIEDNNNTIDRLIEKTVDKNFKREYKEELFAEERPFFLKRSRTVDLEGINIDIGNIFQIQQQAKKVTKFEEKVQKRAELFQDTFNDKSQKGEENCRELYKDNLENPLEHEVDVAAINRLVYGSKKQKKIYKKIAPTGLIHGIYGKIKNDQKDYNDRWESLDKSLKDYWYFLGIESEKTKISLKPNKIKFDKANKLMQKYPHDQLAIEVIKFGCDQQNRNIECSKEKDKFPGNMLNAILPATENVVIEDVKVLNKAFKEMLDSDNNYSIAKPMKDDMVYFKILYAHSSEETKNELLSNSEFKDEFEKLSQEKKERFVYFLEDIGESEKINKFDFLKSQQKEEILEKQTFSDSVILEALEKGETLVAEVDEDDHSEENNNHLEEELAPYYLFNQEGNSIKNKENLLAQETFKLQDSFLGLACAKDKKAGVLSNWMRAKKVVDENGRKIKDKDEQITSDQVKTQREAEKAARAAIKLAGGDLDTVKKKTMPLLKGTKMKFTFRGTPIPLSQAIRVCLESERRRRELEQNQGIINKKIPEKTTIERICEKLTLLSGKGKKKEFSDEEMQEIKKAVSMQIIAAKAFSEVFQQQNQVFANKHKNENKQTIQKQQEEKNKQSAVNTLDDNTRVDGIINEQTIQKQQEEKNKQSAVNTLDDNTPANTFDDNTQVDGIINEFENGSSPKTQEQPRQKTTVNADANKYFDEQVEKQKEDKNQSKDTSLNCPEANSPEADSDIEEDKLSNFEKQPNIQQQINRQSPIANSLARVGLAQKELDNGSRNPGGILDNTDVQIKNTKQLEILNF